MHSANDLASVPRMPSGSSLGLWLGRAALLLAGALGVAACDEGRDTGDAGFFVSDSGAGSVDAGRVDSGTLGPMQIQVQAVFDGDTVRVAASTSVRTPDDRLMAGSTIRFLGIDAPEIAHPPTAADCWGDDAHTRARELLQGRTVTLVFDLDPQCPSPVPAARAQACHVRDAFDRLLAYVVLGDGTVANETFVREGHARSFRAFPHSKTTLYNQLESEARAANRGLWTCPR